MAVTSWPDVRIPGRRGCVSKTAPLGRIPRQGV